MNMDEMVLIRTENATAHINMECNELVKKYGKTEEQLVWSG